MLGYHTTGMSKPRGITQPVRMVSQDIKNNSYKSITVKLLTMVKNGTQKIASLGQYIPIMQQSQNRYLTVTIV